MQLVGSREPDDIPRIRIKWIRGRDRINWNYPGLALGLGKKGSGKSALGEAWAMHFKRIIDLFGSRDNENLAWCRDNSPIDDILLVTGNTVDVDASWDVKHVRDLTLRDLESYEVVTTCAGFYAGQTDRFTSQEAIIARFWERAGWSYPICAIVREASSYTYSRIKQGVRMQEAKADFIYFTREMRHFGFAEYIDTIRWTSIDKEMRDQADYLIIKKVGHQGLPRDLRWLYRYLDPRSMSGLKPHLFIILTDSGAIGVGTSDLPHFHKREGEDLMLELGIEVTKGEPQVGSTPQMVGDIEHSNICTLKHDKELSIRAIQKEVRRSTETISRHLHLHNRDIDRYGHCPVCRRARNGMETVVLNI